MLPTFPLAPLSFYSTAHQNHEPTSSASIPEKIPAKTPPCVRGSVFPTDWDVLGSFFGAPKALLCWRFTGTGEAASRTCWEFCLQHSNCQDKNTVRLTGLSLNPVQAQNLASFHSREQKNWAGNV